MRTHHSLIFSVAAVAATYPAWAQNITTFNPVPSRIVGQPILQQVGTLTAIAPNLVEGRELSGPLAVALDTSASPPILYVADASNNRVLAWKNAAAFTKGNFADKAIGQRDLLSVNIQGPGQDLSMGLFEPGGIAVDKAGRLYVADIGNNRILRYPSPLQQTGDFVVADLVIGQKDFVSRQANEGQGPTEKSLFFFSSTLYLVGLALDGAGNLWVTDAGNNRVLRFPASALGDNPSNEPSADLVLGQPDFVTNAVPPLAPQTLATQNKNGVVQPAGIAIDPAGRVYVADLLARVVVYTPPFALGQLISRIMGVVPPTAQQPTPPKISASTLGFADNTNNRFVGPNGVFIVGNNPYVVDTPNARILGYDPFDQWPDESTAFSPPAKVVIGQSGFSVGQGNRGQVRPGNDTLGGPQEDVGLGQASGPTSALFSGTELYVADTGNNRVLVFPQSAGGGFDPATRLLGQLDFQYNSINLIEGRELGLSANIESCSSAFLSGGSNVVDFNSNPPHLYVSDPANNRILGYLDYRKVNAGVKADLVIGQPDFFSSIVNFPTNNPNSTNAQGLYSPEGLALDSNGNLYVADACNGRVLRFPKPFDQPPGGGMPSANLVLGQLSFTGQPIHDLSRQTMRTPYGIAFTTDGHMVVSDTLANRVLFFRKPAGGDFQSSAPADNVFGQVDFRSGAAGTLNAPRLMAIDPDDKLYVADTSNNRIAIFPNVPLAGDNPSLLFSVTGISAPTGVAINSVSREVWVTATGANQLVRYPRYETLAGSPNTTAQFVSFRPVAVTLDLFGNPIALESGANRLAFYFPAIDYTNFAGGVPGRYSGNAANYFSRFAPGMLAAIFPFPLSHFGSQTVLNSASPIPTTLGDVQVLVGGIAAPLIYVSPDQINFQMPKAAVVGSTPEFQVVRASTGQILASFLFRIDPNSPGLFTSSGSGTGQVAAINAKDGKINGPSNPVKAGDYISLFATGQGLIDGMPPDGQAAQGNVPFPGQTRVFINDSFVPDDSIQYSGFAPGFPGLWQVNVKVPANAAGPTGSGVGDVLVALFYDGVPSIKGPNGENRQTTIRVTP